MANKLTLGLGRRHKGRTPQGRWGNSLGSLLFNKKEESHSLAVFQVDTLWFPQF